MGLLILFPVGYWLVPWLLEKIGPDSGAGLLRRALIPITVVLLAIAWNGVLLIVLLLGLLVHATTYGGLGQDHQEQWAVKGCLRQVRDGDLASTGDCDTYALDNLQYYEQSLVDLETAADKLCFASIQHLDYTLEAYPNGDSLIAEIQGEAEADCSHVAVNMDSVAASVLKQSGDSKALQMVRNEKAD